MTVEHLEAKGGGCLTEKSNADEKRGRAARKKNNKKKSMD